MSFNKMRDTFNHVVMYLYVRYQLFLWDMSDKAKDAISELRGIRG